MYIFKYFYYLLFSYNTKNGRTDLWQSIGIILIFLNLNIHTVLSFFEIYFNVRPLPISLIIFFSLIVLIIFYYKVVSNKKLDDLEFELKLNKKKLIYLNILLFLYIVASLFLAFILLNMAREQNLKSQLWQ